MTSSNPVVVGVDFSACSRTALIRAKHMANAMSASIRVVHTLDSEVLQALSQSIGESHALTVQNAVTDATTRLQAFAAGFAEAAECKVRVGSPADELLAESTACGAKLLVLGVYGVGGNIGGGAGSFASACVRQAPCDVALIDEKAAADPRVIVVGYDFSPTCVKALGFAATLAAATNAELHLLHAYTPPWKQLHYRSPTPTTSAPHRTQFVDALRERLARSAKDHAAGARTTVVLLESDSTGGGLTDYAQKVGADLVIMGKRGKRSKLSRFVLGSTAERLLRKLPTSVVAVSSAE